MDHYGIGAGVLGCINTYFISARQSGRTTSLIESLKDGDRVVFNNSREADRVKRLCVERGLNIEVLIINTGDFPSTLFQHHTPKGRTILDHSLVEDLYRKAINSVHDDIAYYQRQSSGFGSAHYETRGKATELAKWGYYK